MSKVSMLESGVRGFANAVRRAAVKDKKLAEELVYMHGIRGEITPNALKGITKDMFNKSGKLTESGRNEVAHVMKEYNLPQTATWDDALAAIRALKGKAVKIPHIKDLGVVKSVQGFNFPKLELPKMFNKNLGW